MNKLLMTIIFFLLLITSWWTKEITGEGVGPTKDQAKKATADLSQNILVEVKSVQTQLS